MNRIQLACYTLIASAFILSGLLISRVGSPLDNQAYGNLVIDRENFTLLVAQSANDRQSLFILDGNRGRLNIYTPEVRKQELELKTTVELSDLFGSGAAGPGGR